MTRPSHLLLAGALLLGGLSLAFAAPQEAPRADAQDPAVEQARQLLAARAGTWNVTTTMFGENTPGKEVVRALPGGLWVVSDYESTMMGQPFHGHGIFGYDPGAKTWKSVWVDNSDFALSVSDGAWNDDFTVFTSRAEINVGMGPMEMIMRTTVTDADHATFEMLPARPAEGVPDVFMTMSYERAR